MSTVKPSNSYKNKYFKNVSFYQNLSFSKKDFALLILVCSCLKRVILQDARVAVATRLTPNYSCSFYPCFPRFSNVALIIAKSGDTTKVKTVLGRVRQVGIV